MDLNKIFTADELKPLSLHQLRELCYQRGVPPIGHLRHKSSYIDQIVKIQDVVGVTKNLEFLTKGQAFVITSSLAINYVIRNRGLTYYAPTKGLEPVYFQRYYHSTSSMIDMDNIEFLEKFEEFKLGMELYTPIRSVLVDGLFRNKSCNNYFALIKNYATYAVHIEDLRDKSRCSPVSLPNLKLTKQIDGLSLDFIYTYNTKTIHISSSKDSKLSLVSLKQRDGTWSEPKINIENSLDLSFEETGKLVELLQWAYKNITADVMAGPTKLSRTPL